MKVINLNSKFKVINDLWKPRVLTELNGQQVKISKVKGEFVWHDHKEEEELFIILKGTLKMMFRDHTEIVNEGGMIIWFHCLLIMVVVFTALLGTNLNNKEKV